MRPGIWLCSVEHPRVFKTLRSSFERVSIDSEPALSSSITLIVECPFSSNKPLQQKTPSAFLVALTMSKQLTPVTKKGMLSI